MCVCIRPLKPVDCYCKTTVFRELTKLAMTHETLNAVRFRSKVTCVQQLATAHAHAQKVAIALLL